MKKFLVIAIALTVITFSTQAQEFKKFRVGLGGGYAVPGGNGAKGGVLFYLEPSYRVNDQIALGLRLESALLVRGYSETVPDGVDLNIAAIGSYTFNAQYYFNNNNFRPFVGAGLGLYSLAAVKYDADGSTDVEAAAAETKFGFYPRVGFDLSHFTVSIDYNIVGATKLEGDDSNFKNNYIGIRIGGFFGGGKN